MSISHYNLDTANTGVVCCCSSGSRCCCYCWSCAAVLWCAVTRLLAVVFLFVLATATTRDSEMADLNNNNVFGGDYCDNRWNMPPAPPAPKKSRPNPSGDDDGVIPSQHSTSRVHSGSVGRPVPVYYNIAARRRLCADRDAPEELPVPLVLDASRAPRKPKHVSFVRRSRLSLSRDPKPVARRLFLDLLQSDVVAGELDLVSIAVSPRVNKNVDVGGDGSCHEVTFYMNVRRDLFS